MIDNVTDGPTPGELEQLARSVAMSGVLGDHDRIDVVDALRRLAEIDKVNKRHPSNGHPWQPLTFVRSPSRCTPRRPMAG